MDNTQDVMASESPEEVIWLFDKEKCDVVVCVRERQEPGPPSKKRIFEVPVTDVQGEADLPTFKVEKKQGNLSRTVRVHTMSERLARSPYFRVCLKEPWSKEQHKEDGSILQLPLETLLAPPQAYRKCIEFLCSSQCCSPYMFSCPLEALDIYLASDHLLYKECAEACMDFLSAAPWSSEEKKIIHESFSCSSIVPSKEVAARLGLSKEKPISNLKDTLWDLYESCFYPENDGGEGYNPNQLFELIESVLKGVSTSSSCSWSKKAISEFLCEAANDCVEGMKSVEKGEWMLKSRSFLCWLHMTELLLDLTDGKESVMAVASDEELKDFLLPALGSVTNKSNGHTAENTTMWGTIRQVVRLLIEIFKRVAEAKVILSASARASLVTCWVPWLESVRTNEKVCNANDMPFLKAYIKMIVDTLGLDDGDLLHYIARASMKSEYFLEGALKSWCTRLDQS